MRNVRTLSLLAGAALLASGCGGNHASSARVATKGKGKAVVTVTWPQTGRVIPYATSSLVLTLSVGTTSLRTVTIDRPAGQSTTTQTIDNLPYGTIAVAVKAFSEANGGGGVVATGGGSTTVADGQPGSIDVNMTSPVTRIATSQTYYGVQAGTTLALTVNAFDSKNAIVLLSSAAGTEPIAWTLDGTTYGSFGGSATATGISVDFQAGTTIGIAHVAVSLQVGGQGTPFTTTCELDVSATGDHPESALLDMGFPTPRGLAGNLGRGSGNAATGTLGTATPVIASGSAVKVVDGNRNLYAAVGTTLRAFRPDGTDLWTAPVTIAGGVKDLALTKDGRLYAVGLDLVGLDAATGTPLSGFGTFSAGTGLGLTVAPNGDVIYASSSGVRALSPIDHSVRWSSTVVPVASPAVDTDGTVYVRTSAAVAVINGVNGATVRSITVSNLPVGGVAVRNGIVLATSYVRTQTGKSAITYTTTLYALVGATGATAWNSALATNATALGNVGFAFTSDGGVAATTYARVLALTSTGTLRTGWPLALTASSVPSVSADDTIYFTGSSKLYAYGLSGTAKSGFPVTLPSAASTSAPAVGPDGKVYVSLTNGTVLPVQ